MSRQRKLYLSELLNRNTNKKFDYTIVQNDCGIKFETKQDVLNQFNDYEVQEWYFSEYNGFVIFIK